MSAAEKASKREAQADTGGSVHRRYALSMARLDDALTAYRAGDLDRAMSVLDEVLDADPRNADALMLAGLVANRRGDLVVALRLFDRAVRADPEHDAAWTNRAHPLAALGRLDEAEQSVREALALRITPQAASLLLRILLAAGKSDLAARDGAKLLGELPEDGLLAVLTGQALLHLGRPTRALRPLTLALQAGRGEAAPLLVQAVRDKGDPAGALLLLDKLDLDDARAHHLRGTLHRATGDLSAAEACFRQALARDPGLGAAHHDLAELLRRLGRSTEALSHHSAALDDEPDDPDRWIGLIDTLRICPAVPETLEPRIVAALERPFLDHQALAAPIRALLAARPAVVRFLAGDLDEAVLAALDTPLVTRWWQRTVVLDPDFRDALARLRRAGLLDGALDDRRSLAKALALQAWNAGFSWPISEAEARALDALDPAERPLVQAQYGPWPADAPASALPPVLRHLHVDVPALEAHLRASLQVLGEAHDPDPPAPPVVTAHRRAPLPLPARIHRVLPGVPDLADPHPYRILVVGCGTGREVLRATAFADARILGLDPSPAALAVAARHARAWGLSSQVGLAVGPPADLAEGDRFDVILCASPLLDPATELPTLADHLAEDGLIRTPLSQDGEAALGLAALVVIGREPASGDAWLRTH